MYGRDTVAAPHGKEPDGAKHAGSGKEHEELPHIDGMSKDEVAELKAVRGEPRETRRERGARPRA